MGYVYRHIRLDNGNPFYIGISSGNDGKYKRANARAKRNNLWAKIVAKTDFEVEIMFEHDDFEVIKEKEKEFISLYGRINTSSGILSNLTDGGEGTLGWIPSEEKRKNHSEKMKGDKHPQYGVKHSEERKQSNSLAQLKLNKTNNALSKRNSENKGSLNHKSRQIINIITNEIFSTIGEAYKTTIFSRCHVSQMLSGIYENKTNLKYYIKKEVE